MRAPRPRTATAPGVLFPLGAPELATVGAGLILGAAALVVVHVLLRDTYWDYGEGVYALSAHLMLHGRGLYTGMAGAQPPGVFLVGVGWLFIHDSLEWLRFGMACLQLGAGLLAAVIVLQITGSRLAAVLAAPAVLLTPWAVREHGALIPELVALPLLLGALVLSQRGGHGALAGVACGALPLIKVPLVLAAVVIVFFSLDRRRCAAWALATLLVGLAATAALAGSSVWREVVVAQAHTGVRSLGAVGGYWVQAAWNLAGLVGCAALAGVYGEWTRSPRLLRALGALAAALLLTFLTNFKQGTSLNIAVSVEAVLVTLAACGIALAVRAGRGRLAALTGILAALFTLAQSISIVAAPGHPEPFLRPGSRPAWAVVMTSSEVHAAVRAARRCPPGVPYGGPPLIALLADRPVPAGQPDQFLVSHASTLAALRARVAAVRTVCP